MQNDESNPNAWMFFANNNIKAAEILVDKIELTGEVAFLCQQAVEKYLKAFLVANKNAVKKTHDLEKLYLEVKKIKDLNFDETILEQLAMLYVESRYQTGMEVLSAGVLPTQKKARSYLDFAKNVANTIKIELEKPEKLGKA
ncbi:MAG: HEPN domain-containing protein [Fibromonadaceae bacterium]|jgi:HEPN domain-containing protein|nr:HEPN domain-containing protein [Fibromonadaceae bacterium]